MTARIYPTMAQAIAAANRTAVAPLTWNPVDHLLSRFSFGPTYSSRKYVQKYGPDAWYKLMVERARKYPGWTGHSGVRKVGTLLDLSPFDTREALKGLGREYGWDAMDQLTEVTLGLQTWSSSQLFEVLVDFFSNHLNVPNHNGDLWVTRHGYDHDVIRKYATGSFTSMLIASCKHPAMLRYLNLADSTKTAINENYGRELLELHTVGLHYSEDDVKNAARMLSGRTVDQYQHYLYDDYIHATGKIQVLGFSHTNAPSDDGERAGDDLLRYLASHEFTAQNLARKLCVRFVSDNPSKDLVDAVAQAYLDGRTQILPMVSTILRSTEFWESRGKKVRRPAENVIATLRVMSVAPVDYKSALQTLHWLLVNMGHCPLEWPAPNGYPDVAAAWRSSGTLLGLWQTHIGFADNWWKTGFKTPAIANFYGGSTAAKTSGQAIERMSKRITGQKLSATHLAALQEFLAESSTTPMERSSLRWYGAPLAATILDGPHHALR